MAARAQRIVGDENRPRRPSQNVRGSNVSLIVLLSGVVGCGERLAGGGQVGGDEGTGESGAEGTDEGDGDDETSTSGSWTDSDSAGESDEGDPPPDAPDDQCPGLFEDGEDPSVPKLIGPDQPGVYEFAQTPDYLLWVSYVNREMVRLSKCDGETMVVYDSVYVGRHLAVAGDRVVGHGRQKGGNVFSVPLEGGIAILVQEKLPPYEIISLDSDADFAYWIDLGDGLSLRRAPHAFGEEELLAQLDHLSGQVTLGTERVFFTDGSDIKSVDHAGGAVELVAALGDAVPSRLSVDDSHVYGSSQTLANEGFVFRASIDGGPVQVLADQSVSPGQLAIDETDVYWVYPQGGAIERMPKVGGPVETIVDGQDVPEAIAVDAQHLFWSNLGDAGVWVLGLD